MEEKMKDERIKDDEMLEVLKMIAPGTHLREGLENILRARTGALIVIGDSNEVMNLVDGGFAISSEYSPPYLYELAKMDGAIVISKDLKRFLCANALLVPSSTIFTNETGTRHKTAERVARQTNEVVICISQRRSLITIYKGNKKHVLRETSIIINRASQALSTLEKYRIVFDTALNNLSILEFEDVVTLYDVGNVIQRAEMVMKIVEEIKRYIIELGNEGRLLSMQLEELKVNVEEDEALVIEDYLIAGNLDTREDVIRQLRALNNENLIDLTNICKLMGYQCNPNNLDMPVNPRGFRILNKVPRLPSTIVKNMIQKFDNFQGIVNASVELLDDVEGIGEIRARAIKDGIKRIHEQIIWENLRK
jgi:diadenylate cyclase